MEVKIPECNLELAQAINDEARRDPHSPFAGKYVGIASGKVVAVSDDLYQTMRLLAEAEPNPMNRFCLCAGANPTIDEEIWSLP